MAPVPSQGGIRITCPRPIGGYCLIGPSSFFILRREAELSRNDRRVILYSHFLAELGPVDHTAEVLQALAEQQPNLETALDEHSLCNPADHGKNAGRISDSGFVQWNRSCANVFLRSRFLSAGRLGILPT